MEVKEEKKGEIGKTIFCNEKGQKIGFLIASAHKIAIISHRSPDGDTLGAGLGLRQILKNQGKMVENICGDPIPIAFRYLPESDVFRPDFSPNDFDLIITVDAATAAQTGFDQTHPEIFAEGKPLLLNIDHHISNEFFGNENLIDADSASTTMIILKMAKLLGWRISPDAATALLNGLMTDTGSFQHSNTTPEVLRAAARFLSLGADLPKIRKNVFRTNPVSTLKLWGEVLQRTSLDSGGVVTSVVRESDFVKTGADPKDISGAVDYLNMVPTAKYSLLLTERSGKVKGSFRTQRDDVNVSEIAGQFGGGGHVKAAGFTRTGRLVVEQKFRILPG